MDVGEAIPGPSSGATGLPRPLESALGSPPLEPKSWQSTIAPAYIALFLWVVYFDQLGRRTLAIGGLGWSVAGAAVAGLLCYLLLYHVPAMWGQKTGRPLTVLASSTFGAKGTVALTFVGFGLAQVVWLAVATFYAVDWTLQGLSSFGMVNSQYLAPRSLRVAGVGVELWSTLVLITSLFWINAAALVGRYLVRVIAALMNVYPVFPALMLTVAVVLTLDGVPGFRPLEIDPATQAPVRDGGLRAFLLMIQMVFGFFAISGLAAADWGAVSRTPRDVRAGGLVGVAFASWTIATLALLTVAGALGRFPAPPGLTNQPGVGNFSVRVALVLGVREQIAGVIFLVFGLSSLAQTCYASYLLGQRFSAVWPRVSRLWWTVLGANLAWIIVATGLAIRLEGIFTLMGAVFAPMVGAMAADYVRWRGEWPGPRRGVNFAGVVAWLFGLGVGIVPLIPSAPGRFDPSRLQPAAVYAFFATFLIYAGLARLGAEPAVLTLAAAPPGSEGTAPPEPVENNDRL